MCPLYHGVLGSDCGDPVASQLRLFVCLPRTLHGAASIGPSAGSNYRPISVSSQLDRNLPAIPRVTGRSSLTPPPASRTAEASLAVFGSPAVGDTEERRHGGGIRTRLPSLCRLPPPSVSGRHPSSPLPPSPRLQRVANDVRVVAPVGSVDAAS